MAALDGKGDFDMSLLQNYKTDDVAFTVKTYHLTKGVSRRIHLPEFKNDSFEIKGPIGKGLQITTESTGEHFAFGAGTGVLIYIDLIVRMAMTNMGLLDD